MTNTVDKKEIVQFSSLSNQWWDMSGPFSALHKMSNARIEFIKQNAIRVFKKQKIGVNLLDGLNCLDVGCGGGILSEKLTRLGANVTGIDASKNSIGIAKEHAKKSRLKIDYKCITTSKLLEFKQKKVLDKFDLIIASEVIEHVYNRKIFLSDISKLCRPGGVIVFTTINNSLLGILLGKYFAEDILKILPSGTHEVEKFISPENLAKEAEKYGIILDSFTGFTPTFKFKNIINKEFGNFKLTSNMQVNYGAAGVKL
jgi:2-polyprenyl-6-hydroxyphenyl methylase/3-demethylubiquinone-9 3-methyltransferase